MQYLIFKNTTYEVDHAVKGTDFIHGYDATGKVVVAFEGVTDFSVFEYDGSYLAPEDCISEPCNDLKYCAGKLQKRDGTAVTPADVGAAPADSVGTNKVFKKLTDIGITTFPTTMSTVASKMPNNSTLIIDSRDIVSGGDNEISDLGVAGAGTYMIMRGNTASRIQLLHIYGAATTKTSFVEVGNYAVTPNTVTWVRALDNADATYATASASNNYHTAYFTKIGRFVSCTLLPKTTNTTAVYQEDITIPSGYAPSANTTFSIYSDTSKNAGGDGSASVIAYKNGVLRVSSNAGISLAEASKTYCWVTA